MIPKPAKVWPLRATTTFVEAFRIKWRIYGGVYILRRPYSMYFRESSLISAASGTVANSISALVANTVNIPYFYRYAWRFASAASMRLPGGITALASNLPIAIGPTGSVGKIAAVPRCLPGPGTSTGSNSGRQDEMRMNYLNFWKTRGSIAAAPSMPPVSAPAIPGLMTSWPARYRPGTGVRALSASDSMRRGVVSMP